MNRYRLHFAWFSVLALGLLLLSPALTSGSGLLVFTPTAWLYLPLVAKNAAPVTPRPTLPPTTTTSPTASATSTATVSATPSATLSATATSTPTGTETLTPTATDTVTSSATSTTIATQTETLTSTSTTTLSPTVTATATDTPTETETPTLTPTATATQMLAPVDLVIIIDRSESMGGDATCPNGRDDDDDGTIDDGCSPIPVVGSPETNFYDGLDNDGDGVRDDGYAGGGPAVGADNDFDGLPDKDDFYTNPVNCNPVQHCHPFEEVKAAAIQFVSLARFPIDRVALVTMDVLGQVIIPITATEATDLNVLTTTIDSLTMYQFPGYGAGTCQYDFGQPPSPPNNPSGCVSSSTGGALKVAANEFTREPVRPEAERVIVLITDGPANASEPDDGWPGSNIVNKWCPASTWIQPWCRDASWQTRHSLFDIGVSPKPNGAVYDPTIYDADDFARDMADYAACPPDEASAPLWCVVSLNYANGESGQNARIFAVGLGKAIQTFRSGGAPDAGDRLLRYVAAAGDDGDPETDQCAGFEPLDGDGDGIPTLTDGDDSYTCGQYYFVEFGSNVPLALSDIANQVWAGPPTTLTPTPTPTNSTPTPTPTITRTPTVSRTPTLTPTGPTPTPITPTPCPDGC